MSMTPAVSPFVPGRGALPPYLAGRDGEQHELKRMLAYLEHGRGAPRDAIVVGPRGNGKTVLLRWFQREIEAGETNIDVVWLTPSDIRGLDSLATELVPPRRFASLRPESLSFSVGIRLGWELGDRPASLTRLLTARCRDRALVVLLDEAHDLDKDVATVLLNASQSVAADAPILLVLAGGPGRPGAESAGPHLRLCVQCKSLGQDPPPRQEEVEEGARPDYRGVVQCVYGAG